MLQCDSFQAVSLTETVTEKDERKMHLRGLISAARARISLNPLVSINFIQQVFRLSTINLGAALKHDKI